MYFTQYKKYLDLLYNEVAVAFGHYISFVHYVELLSCFNHMVLFHDFDSLSKSIGPSRRHYPKKSNVLQGGNPCEIHLPSSRRWKTNRNTAKKPYLSHTPTIYVYWWSNFNWIFETVTYRTKTDCRKRRREIFCTCSFYLKKNSLEIARPTTYEFAFGRQFKNDKIVSLFVNLIIFGMDLAETCQE